MRKHNQLFVVAEDKVDEFLQEKADESAINRIYDMAEKFEKQLLIRRTHEEKNN